MPPPESFSPAQDIAAAHARIASLLGIELSYQTIWGEDRPAPPETVASLAQALLSVPLAWDDLTACNYFLQSSWDASWLQFAPFLAVEELAQPFYELTLHLDAQEIQQPLQLLIHWENGARSICTLPPAQRESLASALVQNSLITRVRLHPPDWLLAAAPIGYHQILIRSAHRQATLPWTLSPSTVFASPDTEPLTGVSCFLSAVRSRRNWGCGDFTDLLAWGLRAHREGGFDFLALNPLHAIHNRTPYNSSPYLPLSIFNRNYLYLDLELFPDFSAPAILKIFHSPGFENLLQDLRNSPILQIETLARIKKFFLLALYRQFRRRGRPGLDAYRQRQGHCLLAYATYCAFDDYFHKCNPDSWHWRDWPLEFQHIQSPASRRLAARLATKIDFYCYIQMSIDSQLENVQASLRTAGMRLGLYHDLALATDRCGADLWAYQDLYIPAVRVGSPPDDFNENGQDWGFPALSPTAQQDTAFSYFVQSLRHSARHGAALRFDHVMRLARLYWIPDGASARHGAYVRDHFLSMLRLIALESHRGAFEVVGEDLGTVPDYFRASLERFRILSYKLVYFERQGSEFKSPSAYKSNSLCSITTHDLPTLDGFWDGRDIAIRQQLGYLAGSRLAAAQTQRESDKLALAEAFALHGPFAPASDILDGAFSFLLATRCRMILVNTEELFAEPEQQNFPGTTAEQPNWLRRWPTNIEDLSHNERYNARLASWNRARRKLLAL